MKNSIYKVINDFMKYYWHCVDNGEKPLSFYDWLWEFAVNIDDDDYCDIKDRKDDCDFIEDELQNLLANKNEASQSNEEIDSILSDLEDYKKGKCNMPHTQRDINLTFISSKGFDVYTTEGLNKALQWLKTADADNLMYGEPSGDEFDIMVGEMRRPMLISSVEAAIAELSQ